MYQKVVIENTGREGLCPAGPLAVPLTCGSLAEPTPMPISLKHVEEPLLEGVLLDQVFVQGDELRKQTETLRKTKRTRRAGKAKLQ